MGKRYRSDGRPSRKGGRPVHQKAKQQEPKVTTAVEEEEELSAYDLLIASLQPAKRHCTGVKGVTVSGVEVEGVTVSGEEVEGDSVKEGSREDDMMPNDDGSADESEHEEEEEIEWEGGGRPNRCKEEEEEEGEGELDPFAVHFETDLDDAEFASLEASSSQLLHYTQREHPVLGCVNEAVCLSSRHSSVAHDAHVKQLQDLHVKTRLASLWSSSVGRQAPFSLLQQSLFTYMNSYKDLLFTRRTFDNSEEIRKTYVLHALNHVLKTRSKILKNNSRLSHAAREKRTIEEPPRDQGLTRPKVLILVPFRDAALRTVNTIVSLLLPPGEGQVHHRKRFVEEFGGESDPPKVPKPASYYAMFGGNSDDCFRIGVSVKRNVVRLYADFYSADIIIASPLGLRIIIGAEGEKQRDFDFLSSLELVICDQSDVFLMQNWDHVTHVFEHLHRQPKDSHGVDFSRIRMWLLNGWSRFYRQTLVFSSLPSPEINSLFNKHCHSYAGKVRVSEPHYDGSVCQVAVHVSQVFHRVDCSSYAELADARFSYFSEKVLPELKGELMKGTVVFVPSYFDFVRLRNFMRKEEISFAQICEYTKNSDISRARTAFYHGNKHFLLYTERIHFFRRFKLRGVHHLLFYSLPVYHELYPELVNMLEGDGVTCTVLYSRFDALPLVRVVGSARSRRMLAAEDNVHMIVTATS